MFFTIIIHSHVFLNTLTDIENTSPAVSNISTLHK